jgi:hypothetical protein
VIYFEDNRVLTCEHGDLVNVMELPKVLAIEASPQIRHEDLSSLVEAYPSTVEDDLVSETGKVFSEQVDQPCGGVVGAVDAVGETASELLR